MSPAMTKEELLAKALRAKAAGAKALADPELTADYQRLLGGVGDMNPDKVRLHEGQKLNLHGFAIPPDSSDEDLERHRKRYNPWDLPVEANTVNIVGEQNMDANTLAHEFRHIIAPGYSEKMNRLADASMAEKDPEWEDAARMWGDANEVLPSEALNNLFYNLDTNGMATKEYKRQYQLGARPEGEQGKWDDPEYSYAKEMEDKSRWKREREDYLEYEEWNKGLKKRNANRREENPNPTQSMTADALRIIAMPKVERKKQKMTDEDLQSYIDMVRADSASKPKNLTW